MINWTRVKELEHDIGPEDFSEVVELFLYEVEAVIDSLKTAEGQNDLEQDMHFLKGSALNLGFDELGHMCSDAEKIAARGDKSAVPVSGILDLYGRSKVEFLQRVQA